MHRGRTWGRRTPAWAGLALAVACLPACTKSKAAAPALDKASFITQANGFCNQVNAAGNELATPGPDPVRQMQYLQDVLNFYKAGIHKVEGLAEPAADRAQLAAIFHKVDAASALLQQQINKQVSGDSAGANAMTPTVSAAANDANTALSAYGLTACEEN